MSAFEQPLLLKKPDPRTIVNYWPNIAPCQKVNNSDTCWPECRCRSCYSQALIRFSNQEIQNE